MPPPKNEKIFKKNPLPWPKERNEAVEKIKQGKEEGRKCWKEKIGYHKVLSGDFHVSLQNNYGSSPTLKNLEKLSDRDSG